jgi:hypothetical protein
LTPFGAMACDDGRAKESVKSSINDAKRYRDMSRDDWAITKAKMERDVQREANLLQKDIDKLRADLAGITLSS